MKYLKFFNLDIINLLSSSYFIAWLFLLIAFKDVAGVDFFLDIVEVTVVAVGDYGPF